MIRQYRRSAGIAQVTVRYDSFKSGSLCGRDIGTASEYGLLNLTMPYPNFADYGAMSIADEVELILRIRQQTCHEKIRSD